MMMMMLQKTGIFQSTNNIVRGNEYAFSLFFAYQTDSDFWQSRAW